jgi:hypothetical protein
MQRNYSTMNQLYQRLGGASRQERQQLTKLRQDTKDLAAQIKSAISADQSPKMIHDKYVSDFGKMMKDFMQLSNDISKREQSMLEELDRESKSAPVDRRCSLSVGSQSRPSFVRTTQTIQRCQPSRFQQLADKRSKSTTQATGSTPSRQSSKRPMQSSVPLSAISQTSTTWLGVRGCCLFVSFPSSSFQL